MTGAPERISYAEFERVDIRVGRIVAVDDFPEARKPAYKLRIDFGGAIGVKKSSAQATTRSVLCPTMRTTGMPNAANRRSPLPSTIRANTS